MKIIYFLRNGILTEIANKRKLEETLKGNKVILSNGSYNWGFQDSCDKIIMNLFNKHIVEWASSKDIEVEFDDDVKDQYDHPTKKSDDIESVKESTQLTIDDEDIDSLIQSQVSKAEVESTLEIETESNDEKIHPVPAFSDIKAGKYKDPDGVIHERKPQGSKLKGDFTKAIQKFGFENLEMVE